VPSLCAYLDDHPILFAHQDGDVAPGIVLPVAAPHPGDVEELVARLVFVDAQKQVGVVGSTLGLYCPLIPGRSTDSSSQWDLRERQAPLLLRMTVSGEGEVLISADYADYADFRRLFKMISDVPMIREAYAFWV
jgi:hypothetical protein